MERSLLYSTLSHLLFVAVLYVGLPSLSRHTPPDRPILTVELLSISDITNVKPSPPKKPKVVEKPDNVVTKDLPKPALADPAKKSGATPVTKPSKPEPKKPIQPPKDTEKKPVPKKKEDTPSPPKKEDSNEDPFASVLKSIEDIEIQPKQDKPNPSFDEVEALVNTAKDTHYKEGLPLSLSEKDAITNQIMKHWTVIAGARDAGNIIVTIHAQLSQDGTVTSHRVQRSTHDGDPFYRAMKESAIRALYKASPLQGLPADKYDTRDGWREIKIVFDPSQMFF